MILRFSPFTTKTTTTMSSCLYLSQLILLWFTITLSYYDVNSYTYEPPGRDPISIDKIRSSERSTILTTENFDELTAGKLVFLKFYAPYCPHCNAMAEAWNELAEYYNQIGETDVLIGSVDCTDSPDGKNLCMRFKLTGLPSLLYGPTSFNGVYLEEYGGGKSFDELKSFASKELVPKCMPGSLDACTPEDRKRLEAYIAMSYAELTDSIKNTEKELADAKEAFKKKKNEMQKSHDEKLIEKEMNIIKCKSTIKMIEGVREKKKADQVKTEL